MISSVGMNESVTPGLHVAPLQQNVAAATDDFSARTVEMSIQSMMFHSDRAMANEAMQRSLSKVFGKFSLIEKIMRTLQ